MATATAAEVIGKVLSGSGSFAVFTERTFFSLKVRVSSVVKQTLLSKIANQSPTAFASAA